MKKIIVLLFLVAGYDSQSQYLTTKDSITHFYDSLIYHMKTDYLYRQDVAWDKVEVIKSRALEAETFGKSLQYCTNIFDAIDGSHLNLFSDYGWFKWSKGKEYQQEDFNINFLLKYENDPQFEVKVIDNTYGYILLPAMLMLDLSQDSLNLATQQMYDEIMNIQDTHRPTGWIIDLRFNSGGNVFPMLTALYHLLGNKTLYNCIDLQEKLLSTVYLDNGVIHDSEDGVDHATIIPTSEPDLEVPVAIITGILTASSGELIPISFGDRANTITIGEPTAGFTTANSLRKLPFDVKLTLTTSFMTDGQFRYESVISPDILVEREANFDNLAQDANVIQALQFFESRN